MESASGWDTLLTMVSVLMGMATVMLLLSLIVTGLVQFAQSLLFVRSRNLRTAIELVLRRVTELRASEVRAITENIVAAPQIAATRNSPEENSSGFNRLLVKLTPNPRISWIDSPDLIRRLIRAGVQLTYEKKAEAVALFEDLEGYMCKRFQLHVRIITVVCSLAIAFVFQVSTIDLITKLSADPELRAKYLAQTEQLLQQSTLLPTMLSYEDVSDHALDSLQRRHPALAEKIEEAAGKGHDKADIVEELRLILTEEHPESAAVLTGEYEKTLEQLHSVRLEEAQRTVRESAKRLAMLDFGLWDGGWGFYRNPEGVVGLDIENLIGVLLTGIFLTFGAPFWFDRLRELASLRDQLQGVKGGTAKK